MARGVGAEAVPSAAVAPVIQPLPEVVAASLAERWKRGEAVPALAHEAGMSWERLYSELLRLGYLSPPRSG